MSFVSGAADLLNLDSSMIEEHFEAQNHKSVDPGTISFLSTVLQLPQDNANDVEKTETVGIISCKQREIGETVTQSREIGNLKKTDQTSAIFSSTLLDKLVVSDLSDKVDDKGKKCMDSSSKVWHFLAYVVIQITEAKCIICIYAVYAFFWIIKMLSDS